MKQSIFYNSEAQEILRKYSEKRIECLINNTKKEPYEIWNEIENEIFIDTQTRY